MIKLNGNRIKNTALLFLILLIFGQSYGQENCFDIPKMKNYGFFRIKNCTDTIYLGVLQGDSIAELERIYIKVEKKLYLYIISDTAFEIGQFRKFNFISFSKSQFIRMEKKRYWKSYDTKGNIIDLVDNYSQYKYFRIFPCFRVVSTKKHDEI
ncbi:MAG: hypothetical protein B6I18_09190 [Bacteroidetes bacterium 4572_112]|nr:MAG: hypothetical protein B6I18_09190 [Bacteroidetes bacterium 4572_112]